MKKFLLALLAFSLVVRCDIDNVPTHNQIEEIFAENQEVMEEATDCGCPLMSRVPLAPCNPFEEVTNRENSALYAHVIEADASYASTYVAQPDMFAHDKAAVLTCMDPRLLPDEIMGFAEGDMYVIRNAGGRASDDAIRSLIISYKLLGTTQIFVIQHTDCGMQKFTNKVMDKLLAGSLVTATLVTDCNVTLLPVQNNNACQWQNTSKCCGKKICVDYCPINWLTINHGLFDSVLEDVAKIRNHPLIPSNIPIYGFIFDVITGELIAVPKAMQIGRAKPLVCS